MRYLFLFILMFPSSETYALDVCKMAYDSCLQECEEEHDVFQCRRNARAQFIECQKPNPYCIQQRDFALKECHESWIGRFGGIGGLYWKIRCERNAHTTYEECDPYGRNYSAMTCGLSENIIDKRRPR